MKFTFIAAALSVFVLSGVASPLTGASLDPKITGIVPDKPTVTTQAVTVVVNGEGFESGLSLQVTTPGGQVQTIAGADIVAQRPASFQVQYAFSAEGRYSFVVLNHDGKRSAPFVVEARRVANRPTIDQITPGELSKSPQPQVANRTGHDATSPDTANAKAQMLMTQLKGGADFGQLAMDYSEDPQTAPRGGDLGFMPLSQLNQAPPLLRDAVLKSTPGSVKLVSDGGAHSLVLLVAKEEAGQRDLTMPGVKDGIMTTMRNQRTALLRNAYLTAARADAQVTNYLARQIVQNTGKVPGSLLLPATDKK